MIKILTALLALVVGFGLAIPLATHFGFLYGMASIVIVGILVFIIMR